jgi:hypothetical protein
MEQTGWRLEAARCGESERLLAGYSCVCSEYGRRSCGLPTTGSFAPRAARSVPRQGGRSGQPTSSSSSSALQLPKGTPYLKRPSLPSANRILLLLGHGESNRRCTLQVETRDVAAAKNRSLARLLRVFPPAAIPGFNPAAHSTGIYVSHGRGRGRKTYVNLCLLWSCLHTPTFLKPYLLRYARTASTLPHL